LVLVPSKFKGAPTNLLLIDVVSNVALSMCCWHVGMTGAGASYPFANVVSNVALSMAAT